MNARSDMQEIRAGIRAKVLEALEAQRDVAERALADAASATTHADAKQEGKYDTRAIESSYLAGAQSERLVELVQKIQTLERLAILPSIPGQTIRVSSLVLLAGEDEMSQWYMILPGAGGLVVPTAVGPVTVLAPESPIGRELTGKSEGDDVELRQAGSVRRFSVTAVH